MAASCARTARLSQGARVIRNRPTLAKTTTSGNRKTSSIGGISQSFRFRQSPGPLGDADDSGSVSEQRLEREGVAMILNKGSSLDFQVVCIWWTRAPRYTRPRESVSAHVHAYVPVPALLTPGACIFVQIEGDHNAVSDVGGHGSGIQLLNERSRRYLARIHTSSSRSGNFHRRKGSSGEVSASRNAPNYTDCDG